MSATLYSANGTQREIKPANGKYFTLEELCAQLHCQYIEVINCGDPAMIMIGDEESRLHDDFVINVEATRICREGLGVPTTPEGARAYFKQVIEQYGDSAIICFDPEVEEPYTVAGDVIYCPSIMLK